jgi:hypothetical protein
MPEPGANANVHYALLVVFLIVVCWVIFYHGKTIGLERFAQRSFRDWPDQPLATAKRQAQLSRGYNAVINPSLPDPYLYGMLNMSAQENAWNASDWSGTE